MTATASSAPAAARVESRMLALVPLAVVYVALASLYAWQASRHVAPTIFTDEMEFTQLSRSIADTGEATFRGGQSVDRPSLYPWLAAPAGWIDDVPTSYALIKTLGVLLMTAVVFPAYALARLLVGRPWALFAATGAAVAPALAYAPALVQEPLAYPLATLALWLVIRWLARPSQRGFGLALGGCLLATLAREQLIVLFAVLGAAALALLWDGDRLRRWRSRWTTGDRVGAAVLLAGAVIVLFASLSKHSEAWYISTTFFKQRMLEFGFWAAGALAIGLGILPLIAGLASLARPRGEAPDPARRAFSVVTIAAIVFFGFYTAVKGTYLSTTFADQVLERNLIYLTPLLFAGTALLLARGGGRTAAVLASGALATVLVAWTPYNLATYPYYEAHGLSILAWANRVLRWPDETIQAVLVGISVGITIVLALLPWLTARREVLARGLAAGLAVGCLGWALWTEVYAARGEERFSEQLLSVLPKPVNWLDRTVGDSTATFVGQQVDDANSLWQLEFWNRSLKQVWSLDGTAPGPGQVVTADLGSADGALKPPSGTGYAVAGPGVDLAGEQVGDAVGTWRLFRLPADGTIRLSSSRTGIYSDGWMGGRSTFSQYDVEPGERGFARVVLSRGAWCGPDKPGVATIRLGPIGITEGGRPRLAGVTSTARGELHSCQAQTFLLRTPDAPWSVEVEIEPTFSPKEFDPALGDTRQLGAKPDFGFVPIG